MRSKTREGMVWRLLVREVLLHQGHRLIRLEIAGNRQHGVVGGVVLIVKFLDPFELGGVQICHRADGGVRVRRVVLEDQLAQAQRPWHVGLILDAHPVLFLHDRALVLEVSPA